MAKATKTEEVQTNTKKRFLIANVGKAGEKLVAFHVEGNLTREPKLFEATDEKPAMAITSIGINMGAKALYARAAGEPVTEDEEDKNFVSLIFTGKLATKITDEAKKGMKIAVTGPIKTYKNKNDEENIEIMVNNYVLLPKEGGTRNKRISKAARTYINKNDEEVNENIATLLTGRIVNLKPLEVSNGGTTYLSAGLAMVVPAEKVSDIVNRGKAKPDYAEDAKDIISLCLFGAAAENKAKVLKNGMVVAVTGRIDESVYEDKTNYTVYPSDLSIITWPKDEAEAEATVSDEDEVYLEMDEVSDDLPF